MIVYSFYFLLFLFLSSCSFLPERSYTEYMSESEPMYVPNRSFNIAAGDTGQRYESREELLQRTPSSMRGEKEDLVTKDQREMSAISYETKQLEQNQPPQFYEQYIKYVDKFPDDYTKSYYLRLRTEEERNNFLRSKGYASDEEFSVKQNDTDDRSTVMTGMTALQVEHLTV
jgi:hypothetical protein